MDQTNKCYYCNMPDNNYSFNNNYTMIFSNNSFRFEQGLCNPNFEMKLNINCDYYIINNNKYIKYCCYKSIVNVLPTPIKEIFIDSTLDFSNYVRIKKLKEYNFDIATRIHDLEINYFGKKLSLSINKLELYETEKLKFDNKLNAKDNIITNFQNKIYKLEEELNKKDMLNKRLIDTLMLYRYKEFNNTTTYDYDEIKQKNKALNAEFKRVAKLMKLS